MVREERRVWPLVAIRCSSWVGILAAAARAKELEGFEAELL